MDNPPFSLEALYQTILSRGQTSPQTSYVAKLNAAGLDGHLRKVGEEALEVALAAKDGDPAHLVRELADLWFHTLCLMAYTQITPGQVEAELARRQGVSGLEEKARRS